MSQQKLLKSVVLALESADIGYMLTGSFASSMQGEPRATHHIDLVVELPVEKASLLVQTFPSPRFYLSESMARKAIHLGSMFNLIDTQSGDKIDFWILGNDPFDRSRFARRQRVNAFGLNLFVSAPEDTILMKLSWAKQSGGSEKQFGDALRIYEVQSGNLDLGYLSHWARELSVSSLWKRLKEEAHVL